MEAFDSVGLDPEFYTHRPRRIDESFPWDHISTGVRKKYLAQDYLNSLQGKTRIDCRNQCYACGILPTFAEMRSLHPGDTWKCPEVTPKASRGTQNLQPLDLPVLNSETN
jgi:hypothetical protein